MFFVLILGIVIGCGVTLLFQRLEYHQRNRNSEAQQETAITTKEQLLIGWDSTSDHELVEYLSGWDSCDCHSTWEQHETCMLEQLEARPIAKAPKQSESHLEW